MSNKGQAKVSRRRFNLDSVVFSAQQEVTVPAGMKIPASTQYLLKPMLTMPKEKKTIHQGPGKVRVQGLLEGFISCVDGNEAVHTLPVPPMEFMASFATPALVPGTRLEADVVIEGVEVDQGEDNVANIAAYVIVSLRALKCEEIELVTAVMGNSLLGEVKSIKLHHIVKEAQTEKTLSMRIPAPPGAFMTGSDLCFGNLSWQVADGVLTAAGKVMARVYCLGETGGLVLGENSQDFNLVLNFDTPEITDCTLQCYPVKSTFLPEQGGNGFDFELVLRASSVGYREQTSEYIANLTGADSLQKVLHLRNRIGESEFKLNLGGVCQFPVEPGQIDMILPSVRIIETRALDEKVLVRGLLSLAIYYNDQNEQNRVVVQEEEFSQFLELKGCASGFVASAWAWSETGSIAGEHYSVPILLRVEVVEDVELKVVTDVHLVDPGLTPVDASVVLYVAKKDDSLFSIARRFNITQDALRDYNGLTGVDAIHAGQKLLIPVFQFKYK